jgi:hypothetical protein
MTTNEYPLRSESQPILNSQAPQQIARIRDLQIRRTVGEALACTSLAAFDLAARSRLESAELVTAPFLSLLHEAAHELGNLIRCGIECEMLAIDDVHFGLRHVAAIGFRSDASNESSYLPQITSRRGRSLASICPSSKSRIRLK